MEALLAGAETAADHPLFVLNVEDSPDDADLLKLVLRATGREIVFDRVETEPDMRAALQRQHWDIIISDHSMPRFSAPEALKLAKECCPHTPFIIVSGEIDVNLAVAVMKQGATDYIQKRELVRLVPAIERALRHDAMRALGAGAASALEASEARYRRLFEAARDGILIIDAETSAIRDVNPYLLGLLGYAKADLVGRTLWDIGIPADVERCKAAFRQLQVVGYLRHDDLPMRARDGRPKPVEVVSNLYFVDDERVGQCNVRDITDRGIAVEEIRTLNAELEQRVRERTVRLEMLNEELEAFSSSVSHDLRAPVSRIQMLADQLLASNAEEDGANRIALIQNVRSSARHMHQIIDALLQLAHLSLSDLNKRVVDLSGIVRLLRDNLRQGDPGRKVEFAVAEGITVLGDNALLTIVMENLLGNAWKFTSKSDHARIEFGTLPQENVGTVYFVRDNGAGFDMAYADRLFCTFQRLHTQKEFPGSGIGLATVKRIIQRHRGRLWADGEEGKGATFYFTIGDA